MVRHKALLGMYMAKDKDLPLQVFVKVIVSPPAAIKYKKILDR